MRENPRLRLASKTSAETRAPPLVVVPALGPATRAVANVQFASAPPVFAKAVFPSSKVAPPQFVAVPPAWFVGEGCSCVVVGINKVHEI